MKFLTEYFKYENGIVVNGLTNELNIFYLLDIFSKQQGNLLVVASTIYEANKIYESIKTYSNDVHLFVMDDFITSMAVAVSPELKVKRLETLENIKNSKRSIVITNLMGYLRFLPDIRTQDKLSFNLTKNMTIDRDKLINVLVEFGYRREPVVTSTGEFAVRGFVVDIFLIEKEYPIRIEFFDNEIESIRYFNETSQLSIGEIDFIKCLPCDEIQTKEHSSIFDYLSNPLVCFIDKNQLDVSNLKLEEEIVEYKSKNECLAINKLMFEFSDINPTDVLYINTIEKNYGGSGPSITFDSKELECFNSNFDLLKEFVTKSLNAKKTIVFFLEKNNQIEIVKDLFPESLLLKNERLTNNGINIIKGKLNKGFELNDYVVISPYDIEKYTNSKVGYRNTYKIGRKIKGFDQLTPGDYVVHSLHGIGIYSGVITLTKNALKKDYIQINYHGNDKVYVPVEKITSIFKYSSKEGLKPKINRLNSTSWQKTKAVMRNKIKDISEELIKLYAARASLKGNAFISVPEEELFAAEFVYNPTEDQTKAIIEINNDLQSTIPMDRLLCGDVGFGKTEVAFRGIFKAVFNGYQVFYLCPTTILSKQQYESAIERFKNFPVEIALLNRFTTKKEQNRILKGLLNGSIDIVFGTHRLLSEDVKFKKLGMLVVDEEQRFGVTHKEKIKEFKNDVNVLTLSATPIPRTLKMSMSGLRDLSLIDTAPVNRYPVQTYVIADNELLIRDALQKELGRGGQTFILYNKVASIEDKVRVIQKLIPEAKINFAHGQMSKTELEDVMQAFIAHEFDILVCTTIIETGIDIPNANTLIVFDADHFGLSQLYQIRGRVGRSDRIAYAYLMYNKTKMLNDIAVKRLQAIKEFTELGSGYRIAMRDLSIRGAGDLLGSEQAGFVDTVGIELYMQMIDEEIRRINGEEIAEDESLGASLIEVETHISDEYVSDEELKIEIHKKINEIDSLTKLLDVRAELEDRFGKINNTIETYMYEEWFEKLARKIEITKVVQNKRIIQIELPEVVSDNLKADKLFLKAYSIHPKFQFQYIRKKIIISLMLYNLEKHFLYYFVPLLEEIINEK